MPLPKFDRIAIKFFTDLLCQKGEKLEKYQELFDPRDEKIKRAEFGRLYKKLFPKIFERDGGRCRLKIPGICDEVSGWNIDHLIPLSSNKLNKLRKVKPLPGKKIKTEFFGSNHPQNLILACEACNSNKMNKFLTKEEYQNILSKKLINNKNGRIF